MYLLINDKFIKRFFSFLPDPGYSFDILNVKHIPWVYL